MSQVWNLPIDATDLLSDSRVDLNDAFDSLRTTFLGVVDPASLVDGLVWIRSDTNKIHARKAAATITLGDYAAEMGHLRQDGATPLTADWNVGAKKLTNLAIPVAAADAARKNELDLKLALSGGILTGFLTLNADPTSVLHATTKQYADTKLPLAGGTLTGALTLAAGGTGSNAIRRTDIEQLVTFHASVGHRHTGTDARKVRATDLDATGAATAAEYLKSNSGGAPFWAKDVWVVSGTYAGDGVSSPNRVITPVVTDLTIKLVILKETGGTTSLCLSNFGGDTKGLRMFGGVGLWDGTTTPAANPILSLPNSFLVAHLSPQLATNAFGIVYRYVAFYG